VGKGFFFEKHYANIFSNMIKNKKGRKGRVGAGCSFFGSGACP
jgi:hypothetical protein